MGRLLLIVLIVLAVYLLWKAFGPASWRSGQAQPEQRPAIKGPDDDEEFLWKLEKERFKQRREKEISEEKRRRRKEQGD